MNQIARTRLVCLLALVLAVTTGNLFAAWTENVPVTLVQPDGTEVELFGSGDEHYHWLHDADGHVVVRDPETGYWVFADKVAGKLVATSLVAGQDSPQELGLPPYLLPDPSFMPDPYPDQRVAKQTDGEGSFSEINNLVIFIRFADQPEFGSYKWKYQRFFNQPQQGSVSLQTYFQEVSYNQLDITSHLVPEPAANGGIVSYQDIHPRSYYFPYSITTPNGYREDERGQREWGLLQRAIEAVADQIPDSLDLDTNGDGVVDSVTFIIRGMADFWGYLLYPHAWVLYNDTSINGLAVERYSLLIDQAMTIDMVCHEQMHLLGAPDLYRYLSQEHSYFMPVGPWDIMSSWQQPPPHPSTYIKHRYTGWIDSIPEITTSGTYTLSPLTAATGNAYRIASPNSDSEYFVVEYRQAGDSLLEAALPGAGLLVYRINPLGRNASGPPDEVHLFRPGGTANTGSSYRLNEAHLSADVGRTEIGDRSDPATFLSDGGSAGLRITDIGSAGDTISFTVELQEPCEQGPFSHIAPPGGDDTVIIGTEATLEWSRSETAEAYEVYIGLEQTPPLYTVTTETRVTMTDLEPGIYYWHVLAVNDSCRWAPTPIGAQFFQIHPEIESLELETPLENLAADAGNLRIFAFEVPENAWRVRVETTGGSGDLDLFLVHNQIYYRMNSHNCQRVAGSATEQCVEYGPSPGTWYLLLDAITDYSGVELLATIDLIPPASQPLLWFDRTYLVPAAAHNDGLDGTSWVSDISLLNSNQTVATADIYFLREQQNNRWASGIRLELAAMSSLWLGDVVGETFDLQSTGAVLIRSDHDLVIGSRTYNDLASGTYGQFIQGIESRMLAGAGDEVRLIQLTRSPDYRTNLGIVNLLDFDEAITVEVELYRADGSLISTRRIKAQPYSLRLVTDIFATDVADGYIIARAETPPDSFYCFASVIDNRSGDSIIVYPSQGQRDPALIAASANTSGVGGSRWRTDLELHNPGQDDLVARIDLLQESDSSQPLSSLVEMPAGQSIRISNALGTLFDFIGSAALRIEPTTAGSFLVSSRTYAESDSGTFGQMIPAAQLQREYGDWLNPLYLPLLRHSARLDTGFRTNLGLVNLGDQAMAIEVSLYGQVAGKSTVELLGTLSYELPPFSHRQVNGIYAEVTTGDVSNGFARLSTTTPQAYFLGYASVVDNQSDDPSYIPARYP
jgi:M6 family metalloprotease-like protein